MIRLLVCVVLGGVAALFVRVSFTSFLIGVGVGFVAWLVMRSRDTQSRKDDWFWCVVQCTVVVVVFQVVVFRPNHGWISMPSFVLRPSQELQRVCYSRTGGFEDPNWGKGSAQELGKCSGAAAAQAIGVIGRILLAIAAGLRVANVAFAIFLAWLLMRIPPLRQVRRQLVT